MKNWAKIKSGTEPFGKVPEITVELKGFEPSTYTLRTYRSPS